MPNAAELEALRVSLLVAGRAVAVALPLAILVGWLLARSRLPGRTGLDILVHLPLVLPPVVVGYLLLTIFGVQGPVGRWLDEAGVRLVFTSAGASLAAGVMAFPLMVRAVRLSIEAVDPASVASERGLNAGDIITEAGQQPVETLRDLSARIDEAKEAGRNSVLLLIRRGGDPRFVALPIE